MRYRRLGCCEKPVSAIGLGAAELTGLYGPASEDEAAATLAAALDAGVNLIDTADNYADGANERLVGRVIAGRRESVVLATKFGNLRNAVNGRPDYAVQACEASLRRLGTDVVDIFYLHRVDPAVPVEETVGAMARLVEQGKVRWLGLSEAGPETLRRAHATHPIAALQTEYSLWTRFVEADILPACRALGVGFVAYSPLGRGMLTGAVKDAASLEDGDRRRDFPNFRPDNIDRNLALVTPFLSLAREKGVPPARLALAWLLAQGPDIAPIPGSRRRAHMMDNIAAADLVLTAEEVRTISEAVDSGAAAGARYPERQLPFLGI